MRAAKLPIVAQVRRQLGGDAWRVRDVPRGVRDRVADRAMQKLWGSRVKTFVPVLALRHAREALRVQGAGIASERRAPHPVASPPPVSRSRDVLRL